VLNRNRIVVVDAPSNLGLRPAGPGREPGCRRMGEALRAAGIVQALAADDAGDVAAPPYVSDWVPGQGVRNGDAIAAYSRELADRLEPLIDGDRFVVVLGGDCSILLGSMLALRRLGRYGLIFIDGHLDFRHPGNAPYVGAAAGEDLAIVTGRGDPRLIDLEGHGPLVADGDVVALGFREGPAEAEARDILETDITLIELPDVRRLGVEAAAETALAHLRQRGVDGIWIHVDVDVIDSALMPAVDSPAPDGLDWPEFERLLQMLRRAPETMGIELTIFDPDLDPDGRLAERLTASVVSGLRLLRPGQIQ
jgi:arginase